jgi:hypothetical protein
MLLKKTLLWKIYLYEKILFLIILHYKDPNNLYLSKISRHERICEIESRFGFVYFFLMHPVYKNTALLPVRTSENAE